MVYSSLDEEIVAGVEKEKRRKLRLDELKQKKKNQRALNRRRKLAEPEKMYVRWEVEDENSTEQVKTPTYQPEHQESTVVIPQVVGKHLADAVSELKKVGLKLFPSVQRSPDAPPVPIVRYTVPVVGTEVPIGSSVTLVYLIKEDRKKKDEEEEQKKKYREEESDQDREQTDREGGQKQPERETPSEQEAKYADEINQAKNAGRLAETGEAGVVAGAGEAATGTAAAGTVAAGTATAGTVAATSEIWGPIALVLGVLFLVFALLFFVIVTLSASCTGLTANFTRSLPTLAGPLGMLVGSSIDQQICGQLGVNPTQLASPAVDTIGGQTPGELGLVPITGVPVEGASDPRLRQCMLNKVQRLYQLSQEAGLEWVVTSAYRPHSSGSYHARGEAVDIAFRNPPLGFFSSDPRIDQVIQLARSIGFVDPAGDVVDEYNQPSAKTEGPHIHLEFNYNFAQQVSYCDSA